MIQWGATLMALAVGIAFLGVVYSTIILIRNQQVFKYRAKVLEGMRKISVDGSLNDTDWIHLYEQFLSVSYEEMVSRFWRPLDSFFPEELLDDVGMGRLHDA